MNLPPKLNEDLNDKAEKLGYMESIRLFCKAHGILYQEGEDTLKILK